MFEDKRVREKRLAEKRAKQFTSLVGESQPRYGLKKFTEQYNREQAEAAQRPIRKLEQEFNQGLRENQENVRRFFSRPLEQLNQLSLSAVPVDLVGDYPTTSESITREQYAKVQLEFWETLNARSIRLSEDGWIRLNIYVGTIARERGFAVTSALLEASFQRLFDLGCFAEDEVTGYQAPPKPAPAPAPQPKPSIDGLRGGHREERKQILEIVGDQWGDEFANMFYAWTQSLREKWGYVFPVDELGMKAARYIQKWNLSPFSHATYDQIRRAFSKLAYFTSPDGQILDLRLESEKLDDLIASDKIPMDTFEQRQELGRMMRDAAGR
jgi:hypothetical protein